MEKYRLSWTPSTSLSAFKQDVFADVGGTGMTVIDTLNDNVGEFVDHEFGTDASVEWFVRTSNADGAQTADSAHSTFVAANLELQPATGLSQTWLDHTDVQ